MKRLTIVHVSLASSFTENMAYQENFLSAQNIADGHNTIVISNTAKFIDGKMVDVPEEDTVLDSGLRLIRLKFSRFGSKKLSEKIRKAKRLYNTLLELKPDIIFSHSTSYYSLLDCVKYVKKHPGTRLVADNHANAFNSGKNPFSNLLLHKGLYRFVTKKALKYLAAYYCVGVEEMEFARRQYAVPERLLKLYPLGGKPLADDDYNEARKRMRKLLGFDEDSVVFLHSGKLDKLKRTDDLLKAFLRTDDKRFRLIIIGAFADDTREKLTKLIESDDRIVFLGWKTNEELADILCACDVYCQPGSVSATLQNAICHRCAIMAYPHDTYVKLFDNGCSYWTKNQYEIANCFKAIETNQIDVGSMKQRASEIAVNVLDYGLLAKTLYTDCGFNISES